MANGLSLNDLLVVHQSLSENVNLRVEKGPLGLHALDEPAHIYVWLAGESILKRVVNSELLKRDCPFLGLLFFLLPLLGLSQS
jgi:hypothetical protein